MKWLLIILLMHSSAVAKPYNVPQISMDDICMSHIINKEAAIDGIVGQRAVYDAVKVRMARRNLSTCSVVRQPYQFSSVKKGEKFAYDEKLLTTLNIVRKLPSVVREADMFYASWGRKPKWARKFKLIAVVKHHRFYNSSVPA